MITQRIERVYPPGYTGGGLGEINDLLEEGWIVKFITPVKTDASGGVIHDYVLEKDDRNN